MALLAIDIGTKLGWAIQYNTKEILHGVNKFSAGRFEGGGMRWVRFRAWLNEMHDGQEPITQIYFEEVRAHRGTDAAHIYGGFLAALTEWCEAQTVPYSGIPVGTIKKHATGKGNAGKPAVIQAMRAKGFTPEDDNDADALALLHFALEQ